MSNKKTMKQKTNAHFETITPHRAKQLLEGNKQNRPLNERNLASIIHAMKKGSFHLTGESIKIAEDGTLIDGQHRLHAISKTGMAQKMLVITGLEKQAFKYIDIGKPRSAADVLTIEGVANSTLISGTIKCIMYFKQNKFGFGSNRSGGSHKVKLTNAEISDFYHKNKDGIMESLKYGQDKRNKILSKPTLSAFHFLFNEKNPVDADMFCHRLADGSGLESDSPIYILRQRLIQEMRSKRKIHPLERNALICKAWNAYRGKKKIQVLRWDSVKEAFPKPI